MPFMALSKSTYLYASGQTDGPFRTQINSISAFGVDKCSVSFVSTLSPLNCQGKVTSALYYEAPNATLLKNGAG